MNTIVTLSISDKDSDATTTRRFDANGMSCAEIEGKVNELVDETGYQKVILNAELCDASEELVKTLEDLDVDVLNL